MTPFGKSPIKIWDGKLIQVNIFVNKQKVSLEESCESLIVGTADGREERFLMCELIYLNTSYKAIKPYSLIEMAKFCYTSGTVLKLQ